MLNLAAIFLLYTKRNPATSHNLFNTFLSAITTDVFLVQPTAIPMAHSSDHEDTQVVDSPPPDTVPFDDETQPVDDCYDLYGETQVVEEDDGVVRRVEEWVETQAVDDLEETPVLDDDDNDDDVFEKKVANWAVGGVGETLVLVGDGVRELVLANIVDDEHSSGRTIMPIKFQVAHKSSCKRLPMYGEPRISIIAACKVVLCSRRGLGCFRRLC
ncbi:hypothetical protein M6B38_171945 [Iris pallida]|uniref:Uncharacterized protein n=1 Tax=Iris pallida TaxID=29817 RepID=A0AAX6EVK2_IRIPA|nr:hypothetical protein M6B38_171945 [Iris pallida]